MLTHCLTHSHLYSFAVFSLHLARSFLLLGLSILFYLHCHVTVCARHQLAVITVATHASLGPKFQSTSAGYINVNNNGTTIFKLIQLNNAAAKTLVNISNVRDEQIGDGTSNE